jgi:hypothetical protein
LAQLCPFHSRREVTLLTLQCTLLTLQYSLDVVLLPHHGVSEHRCVVLSLLFHSHPVLLTHAELLRGGHLRELDETGGVLADLHSAQGAGVVRDLAQHIDHHAL